jgi:hypothetical protein
MQEEFLREPFMILTGSCDRMSLQQEEKTPPMPEGNDAKVLDYINQNKGALKWSQAVNDLEMTREEIETSIKRLTQSSFLKGSEPVHNAEPETRIPHPKYDYATVGPSAPTYQMGSVRSMRIYGCEECGSPISAYPPDDVHTVATGRSSPLLQTIDIKYLCHGCGGMKFLHWRRPLLVSFPLIVSTYLRSRVFPLLHRSISVVLEKSIKPHRR